MTVTTEDTSSGAPSSSARENPKAKVVYDYDAGLIQATLIVSKPLGADQEILRIPVIAIPGARPRTSVLWTVTWELVAGEGVDNVEFCRPGLEGPSVWPQGLERFDPSPVEGFPAKWQAEIQHRATDSNTFQYWVYYKYGRTRRKYDPTIVVCQDPVGQNLG